MEKAQQEEGEQGEDIQKLLAEIELINVVKADLESGAVLDMNEINSAYNRFLGNTDHQINYKRDLKNLITNNISEVAYTKPQQKNKPEKVSLAKKKQEEAANNFFSYDTLNMLFQASIVLRRELLKTDKNWKFKGDYEDFELSNVFKTFVRWILVGPKPIIGDHCEKEINHSVSNISQILYGSMKSKSQVEYKHSMGYYKCREIPFSIGLGMHVYYRTRSKELLDCLSNLNLSITYDKTLQIQTSIANAVCKVIDENNGSFIPPSVNKEKRVFTVR